MVLGWRCAVAQACGALNSTVNIHASFRQVDQPRAESTRLTRRNLLLRARAHIRVGSFIATAFAIRLPLPALNIITSKDTHVQTFCLIKVVEKV